MTGYYPRRVGGRLPKRAVIVITEGQTEEKYFSGLRRRQCDVKIKTPRTKPTDAVNLVEISIQQAADNGLDLEEGGLVICVFDVEGNTPENLKTAIDLANANGIILAVSNPCFELWYLLHFQKVPGPITCEKAQSMLKKHIPNYRKAEDYRELLDPRRAAAMQNARNLCKQHGLDDAARHDQPNSSTTVHRAVGLIEEVMDTGERRG